MTGGHRYDKILDYYDVVLRREDADLFRLGQWLNDNGIAFYFEYLVRELFQPGNLDSILLIPGATTYLLTNLGKWDPHPVHSFGRHAKLIKKIKKNKPITY